jgi:ATP-dependent protease Clp ATPase subunit
MQQRDKECSFCGNNTEECKYLIAGPLVYICDVCVEKAFNAIRASEAGGGEGGLIDLFDAIADVLTKD